MNWGYTPPIQWWNIVKSSFPHLESAIIEHHHFTGRLLYWHPPFSNSHSWYWWVMTWLHQKLHNLAAPPQMLATLHCGAFGRLPKEGPGWNSPPASRHVTTWRKHGTKTVVVSENEDMWVWINTYFHTIFRGMNIHLPAILMWTKGVQGFDTLPCLYITGLVARTWHVWLMKQWYKFVSASRPW